MSGKKGERKRENGTPGKYLYCTDRVAVSSAALLNPNF